MPAATAPSTAQPKLLLTGFEPFGGDAVNPSWLVAQALHGQVLAGVRVQSVCLPCAFGDAAEVLGQALRRHRPVLVLALGLASGREGFTVERVAINVDDARIPDNAGRQPVDAAISRRGPAAHFATLPIKAMVAALQQQGWPAAVSQTAGTFVCNHVFYALMQALRRRRGVRGGFMHLPLLPEQAGGLHALARPCLALDVQTAGVRTALLAALSHGSDLAISGGAES